MTRLSLCAALLAEACNTGYFRPIASVLEGEIRARPLDLEANPDSAGHGIRIVTLTPKLAVVVNIN